MPELPDVEIYKRYLDATALHQEVAGLEVHDDRILAGVSQRMLTGRLRGRALEETRRHGKHLFARAGDAGWLRMHFGMTGFLRYYKRSAKAPGHVRLHLQFANGFVLAFDCRRLLGEIGWVETPEAFAQAEGLGPDAVDGMDADRFRERLAARKGYVKAALMDQKLIAGIGNVYSDEILFQARLHPRTRTHELSEKNVQGLYDALRKVLAKAIEAQADPEKLPKGYLTPHRGKDGKCPRCGGAMEKVAVGGRRGYYCPKCQKGA